MDTAENHTFALLRLSAVTHSVNNDMRRIPLVVRNTKPGARLFRVRVPRNPAVVPAGYYFLFAIDSQGVPSLAKTILIEQRIPFKPLPVEKRSAPVCAKMRTNIVYHITSRLSRKGLRGSAVSKEVTLNKVGGTVDDDWRLENSTKAGFYRILNLNSGWNLAATNADETTLSNEHIATTQGPELPNNFRPTVEPNSPLLTTTEAPTANRTGEGSTELPTTLQHENLDSNSSAHGDDDQERKLYTKFNSYRDSPSEAPSSPLHNNLRSVHTVSLPLEDSDENRTTIDWCFISLANGYHKLHSPISGKVLATTEDGHLVMEDSKENDKVNQQWKLRALRFSKR